MPDCPPFSLKLSGWAMQENDACTVAMDPPLKPGCTYSVTLDGVPVGGHDSVGDFRCVGQTATGIAEFKANRNEPRNGRVAFYLKCEGCGPTTSSNIIELARRARPNTALQVFLTICLPLTGLIVIAFGLVYFGCEILCSLRPLAGQQRCNCDEMTKAMKAALDILPEWVKAPFK